MEGLKLIPFIALILTIAGIIIGASVIVMDKFGDTMTVCYNSSYTLNVKGVCNGTVTGDMLSAGKDGLNFTDEYYTKYKATEGLGDVAEQQPTVAVIAVMVVIISVIAGVFAYMNWFA